MERRETEKSRRQQAQAHKGEIVPGSGELLGSRNLEHMISVRLGDDLVSALRGMADRRGVSLSGLIREALQEHAAQVNVTSQFEYTVVAIAGTVPETGIYKWLERPTSRSALRLAAPS